ncbi:DNL-type zinc finger protein [Iris pallida]|uniref:DNL-type zinc finger protein n=1 Tax=Iris pallida TaxID=29817 RepID=A0AAX6EPM5_IRIPA|nr:DNL-type zinc finger protein [Iris pallida]
MVSSSSARVLSRRLASLLLNRSPNQTPLPLPKGIPSSFGLGRGIRRIQTTNGSIVEDVEDTNPPSSNNSNPVSSNPVDDFPPDINYTAHANLKTSARHDLAMVFTCRVCETRSVKTACRESYEKGVVVARCSGCNNLHLIADRLGWFGEPGSVEDFLAARGEEVMKGSADTLNLTLEDLAGTRSSS